MMMVVKPVRVRAFVCGSETPALEGRKPGGERDVWHLIRSNRLRYPGIAVSGLVQQVTDREVENRIRAEPLQVAEPRVNELLLEKESGSFPVSNPTGKLVMVLYSNTLKRSFRAKVGQEGAQARFRRPRFCTRLMRR